MMKEWLESKCSESDLRSPANVESELAMFFDDFMKSHGGIRADVSIKVWRITHRSCTERLYD